MKKIIGFSVLLFLFYISFGGVINASAASNLKTENITPAVIVSPSDTSTEDTALTPSPTQEPQVNYTLPYPGILPDNPLYFLKAARDRLISFLISDSEKKAEFALLTSDKRVSAAQLLMDRGKDELAITTISKSNNYLSESIGAAATAKSSGKNVDAVLGNLKGAIKKHEEVLDGAKKKINSKFSSALSFERKRLSDFEKSVDKLSPQS